MELWLSGSIISEDVNKIDKLDIPGISGVEFGFLESTDDLEIINNFVKNKNIDLGFHHPIVQKTNEDFALSRQITSHKKELRNQALNLVRLNMSIAVNYGARYFLVHAPTIIRNLDEINVSENQYKMIVNDSLEKLEEMSERFNLPVLVESDGPNPFYNTPESLKEMFEEHKSLQHCLDTMHFAVFTGKYEYPCSISDLVDAVSDVTYSIHLSNTISPAGTGIDPRPTKGSKHVRLPVHPDQNPQDGWIDILEVIQKVKSKNKTVILVMEHIPFRSFDREVLEKLGYNLLTYEKESISWFQQLTHNLSLDTEA